MRMVLEPSGGQVLVLLGMVDVAVAELRPRRGLDLPKR